MTTSPYPEVTMSNFEQQEAMLTNFLESLEKLGDLIDSSDHSDPCGMDAKWAQREFEDVWLKTLCIVLRKARLENWLIATENAASG